MILNSVVSSIAFPNETLFININNPSESSDNTRLGVRVFNYYYYNEKYAVTNNFNITDVNNAGLLQPTNSASIPTDFPLQWSYAPTVTPARANHALYLSFTGGTSGITVHPSQPYPIINKISNNSISVSAGFLPFQYFGYDDVYDTISFRKNLPLSSVRSGQTSNLTFSFAAPPYYSQGRRNFTLSTLKNYSSKFSTTLGKNIIDNSFSIQVPLVTSKKVEDSENVFLVTLYGDRSNPISLNTGDLTFAYLPSEDIAEASGISNRVYFNPENKLVCTSGKITLNSVAPLLFAKNEEVTISYETSANLSIADYTQTNSGTNFFTLATVNPVYFYNQRFFFKNTTGGITTNRDAFTISFYPSAGITSLTYGEYGVSEVNAGLVFVDNYYQTSFTPSVNSTKAKKRFLERTKDNSLSAFDSATNILYNTNGWMPASAIMKFVNDGEGNQYTVGIQVSTFTGAIYDCVDDLSFVLNNKKVIFDVYLSEYNDVSATVMSHALPSNNPDVPIKWDVFPPENIVLSDPDTGEIIPLNDPYISSSGNIIVKNLGVDKTKITLYTEEFDLSASTYWYPSSGVLGSTRLQLVGLVEDYNKTNTGLISAMINRNGLLYRPPTNSNIIWNEIQNPSKGTVELFNGAGNSIEESTIYSSNDYSVIYPVFSTLPVDRNPSRITFNITCSVFDEKYSFDSSKLLFFRQYPDRELLTINASTAVDTVIYTSLDSSNIITTSTGVWFLTANYPDLVITAPSEIKWKINYSNGTVLSLTGDVISASINSYSAVVTISAEDITPYYGNFRNYNFVDTLQFFILSSIAPLSYISFPSKNYYPSEEMLGVNNYTNSHGNTSLKPCNTETFTFSATPGFNNYVWSIGDITYLAENNIAQIPITYNNVSSNNSVHVSAFDNIFLDSDLITKFNYASSDSSNIYKSPITFIDYPSVTASIILNNDLVDITRYSQLPVLFIDLGIYNTDISYFTFDLILSSTNSIQHKSLVGNSKNTEHLIKFGLSDADFNIKQNSLEIFDVSLSGSVFAKYGNLCNQEQVVFSNTLTLSAFNGPELDIYTETNYTNPSAILEIFNYSGNSFVPLNFKPFSAFIFHNGESSTLSTTLTSLTTTYINPGIFSPSLTGIFQDGSMLSKTFNNLIHVVDAEDVYDSDILTDFSTFDTPFKLNDVIVPANSWQYADVINTSFEKLKGNVDYIIDKCKIYDATFPFATGGFLGELYGNFKWITSYDNQEFSSYFNIKCADIINTLMVCIEDGFLSFYDISGSPSLLYKTKNLNNISLLRDINRIKLSSDKIYMLDSSNRLFYILSYTLSDISNTKLIYYWGGEGVSSFKTKFINPIDFDVDESGFIYILDTGNNLVKKYDSSYQWVKDISLNNSSESPTSISVYNDWMTISYETSVKLLYKEVLQMSIPYKTYRTIMNPSLEGVTYSLFENNITKILYNGQIINTKKCAGQPIDVICDSDIVYIIYKDSIEKLTDSIKINTILSSSISSISSWSDVFVGETEFVTDYVYNDSFKKIHDKATILNNSITGRILINRDEYSNYLGYDITSSVVSSIPSIRFLALNEPVNYATINSCIESLYYSIDSLKSNTQFQYEYPNYNDNIQWKWANHYINTSQKPSLLKNPVSWSELRSSKLNNTSLSSVSAWYVIRGNGEGNHSHICWNYEYLQNNSYFPLTWEQMEQYSVSGHIFSWDDIERNCCDLPDFVFDDCANMCK